MLAAEGADARSMAPDLATIAASPLPVVAIPPRAAELCLSPHAARRKLRPVVVCDVDGSSHSLRAAEEAACLIAAGCHGLSRDRLALSGSVTRALVRGAGRPVLVSPPIAPAEAASAGGEARERRPAAGIGAG